MKRILLTTALILAVCIASMGKHVVTKGESNSAFGNYKIEQLDDHLMLNNKELDKYLITYEKTNLQVIVVLDKQKKCKKYYVLSDKLPIQYECNGSYFGIKKLDKELSSRGFKTSMDQLNKEAFYRQRVLTSEISSTLDHLNLIASYYPSLFNEKTLNS